MKIFKGMEFEGTIVLNLKLLDVEYDHNYISLIQHEITHFIQDLERIHAFLKSKVGNLNKMPLAGISPLQITKKTMKDKKINFSGFFKGKDDFETQKVKRIDHDKRPVEFQTNLISLVGDFKKDYLKNIIAGNLKEENGYEIPDDFYSFDSYGSNLGWKNKIENDDKILEFLNNRNNKKLFLKSILINLEKTDLRYKYYKLILVKENPELYKWYLSNIYKEFVNKDIDMDYLKLLTKQDRLKNSPESNKKDLLIDTLESLKGKKEQKYYNYDIKFSKNINSLDFKIDNEIGNETWHAYKILIAFYGDQKKYDKEIKKNGRRMDYEKLNEIFKIIKRDKKEFRKKYAEDKIVLNKSLNESL
jgi:hypothetical protein